MEKASGTAHPGAKQLNLKKSFRQAVRSLLTAFPFEVIAQPDFLKLESTRHYLSKSLGYGCNCSVQSKVV